MNGKCSLNGIKRWKDSTGKWRRKQKTFVQYASSFNRNADGSVKSRRQIYAELDAELTAWYAAVEE